MQLRVGSVPAGSRPLSLVLSQCHKVLLSTLALCPGGGGWERELTSGPQDMVAGGQGGQECFCSRNAAPGPTHSGQRQVPRSPF